MKVGDKVIFKDGAIKKVTTNVSKEFKNTNRQYLRNFTEKPNLQSEVFKVSYVYKEPFVDLRVKKHIHYDVCFENHSSSFFDQGEMYIICVPIELLEEVQK